MFTGEHPLTIDDKGRLAVPARFRQQIAESQGVQLYAVPITTPDKPPHLEVYPAAEFKRLADLIQNHSDRRKAEQLKRGFIGPAVMSEIDAQGRIMLPLKLREEARLNGRVTVVGQITRFDVWDDKLYEATRVDPADLAEALALIPR